MRYSKPLKSSFLAVLSLLLALSLSAGAQRSGDGALTQRRINEWAAALERARFALVEDTGLRLPQETLTVYLRRISQPLPGEKPAAYWTRIDGYVKALAQAADATAPVRQMPALRDNGPANRQVWQRTVKVLSLLPERLRHLRAARQAAAQRRASGAVSPLGAELAQTLNLELAAFAALRDARP